jgi:type IV secretory pathway TraG/TraD family ATPase VirD4
MYAVRAWCQDPTDPEFLKALQASRSGVDWDNGLMALCAQDGDFLTSATTSAEAALGWMDNPALAAVACPRVDGEPVLGLDVARFLREGNGTIYLIGRKRPYGSLTPYFSAFVSEFMEQAGALAEEQGGKLRVPMLVAADEAATTAKIDFAEWCALTAGWNITVVAGFQSVSQIETGWGGQAACETILDLMSTKVIAGGFTSPPALERFSGICGDYDCWRKEGGAKTWTKERVFPPERIRQLKRFHALVVHRVCKPVEIVVTPVWEHPAHQEVVIEDAPEPGEAPDEVTEE